MGIGIECMTSMTKRWEQRSLVWLFSTEYVDDPGGKSDTVAARKNSLWEI
jgi:hypothetical protein